MCAHTVSQWLLRPQRLLVPPYPHLFLEQGTRFELALGAWKAPVLPLHQPCRSPTERQSVGYCYIINKVSYKIVMQNYSSPCHRPHTQKIINLAASRDWWAISGTIRESIVYETIALTNCANGPYCCSYQN